MREYLGEEVGLEGVTLPRSFLYMGGDLPE
jgi:hypothetical protein